MVNVRVKSLVPAVAWTLLIIILLSIPSEYIPSSSAWNYDKVGHAVLFAGLAFLWMRAFEATSIHLIIVILVCGLFFAPLTELYQSILPSGRHADLKDSLADAIGFSIGTVVWIVYEHQKRQDKKSQDNPTDL